MSVSEGMIQLTRLNYEQFYLNPDLIQEMEKTPDTVLTLSSGARIVVQEAPERVIDEVVAFRKRVLFPPDQPESAPHETR